MKFRDVVIFNGKKFSVPQGIQRIDTRATHGWQVRYGGTKLFSDYTSDGSGARESLQRAQKELARRIATLPAPSMLQKQPSGSKSSGLPVGVSGPIFRQRGARVRSCSFSVLLPQYGQPPRCSSVYIGTENTYSAERYQEALEKAVALRREAEEAYERAATKAKRADAKVLKEPVAEPRAVRKPLLDKLSAERKPPAAPAAKRARRSRGAAADAAG
jgi:hypothetical protein